MGGSVHVIFERKLYVSNIKYDHNKIIRIEHLSLYENIHRRMHIWYNIQEKQCKKIKQWRKYIYMRWVSFLHRYTNTSRNSNTLSLRML